MTESEGQRLKRNFKKWISLCCGLLFALPAPFAFTAHATQRRTDGETQQTGQAAATSYFTYYQTIQNEPRPDASVRIDGVAGDNAAQYEADGVTGVLLDGEKAACSWNFSVPESGAYSLYVTYYALPGKHAQLPLTLELDGEYPFDEAESLTLSRLWRDVLTDGKFPVDASGGELRPSQEEVQRWNTATFLNTQGLYDEPYLFYLEAGEHTLRLTAEEPFAVEGLSFENENTPPSYEEYRNALSGTAGEPAEVIRQEAEYTYEKNNQMLYPSYDRTDPATLPNDPAKVRLNTIGQSNWSTMGDAISWRAEVEQAGWYQLYFRSRQDSNPDAVSSRRLLINGEVPFQEALSIPFAYADNWYIQALGGETPLAVYLKPGDILTMECAGGSGAVTRNIYQAVLASNEIYRKIIVITGASPDIYRDYRLETQIPDLKDSLREVQTLLTETEDMLTSQGKGGPVLSSVKEMAQLLKELEASPYTIPERLSVFKSDIESLGSLLLTVGSNPLELDCFYFVPEGKTLPKTEANLWDNVVFQVQKFIASFTNDYNAFSGEERGQKLSVWVSTGRDQAQLLSVMIDDSFTPQTGVPIQLSLVDTGATLIQATLAGKGPDVALMIPSATPINLAMRGALVDLSGESFDLDSLMDEYYPETWTPYRYQGGIYAIPETQTFDVMFYRTDILQELGIEPPQTWAEFYEAVKTLQKNNLGAGIQEINSANPGVSASITAFDRFLLQRGGTYYNENLSATEFGSPVAYDAFEEWVNLYKKLGLDREFDFFNRFRSGEMPLGISSYTTYNQILAAAPEIRGLWDFTLVPGTPTESGVDRTETSSGTACMMLKAAEKKEIGAQAFAFLKWWTQADTQARYGRELETMMGVASRYAAANRVAFEELNWTDEQKTVLRDQWEQVVNMPEIPGNYVVSRYLTNALRSALNDTGIVSRRLDIYNKMIHEEITRKRREFGLD